MQISSLATSRIIVNVVHNQNEHGLSHKTIKAFGLSVCQKGIFNKRIIIPIHDSTGALIAHAGRGMSDTKKNKYIFSEGFDQSSELFNLHRVIPMPNKTPLIIVQGFFDVMRLWQHGVRRVVALMGNSISIAQEMLIHQFIRENSRIIILLNNDDAGYELREEVLRRLTVHFFLKVCSFNCPGDQPKDLNQEQAKTLAHFK